MDAREILDRHNESNDRYAIAVSFLVAGVGRVQELVKLVDEGRYEAASHGGLLEEAEALLDFGLEQLGASDRALSGFVLRQRALLRELAPVLR